MIRVFSEHGAITASLRDLQGNGGDVKRRAAVSLFIDIPAVGDAGDAHHPAVVIDDVRDAVITHADAPEILVASQFPTAGRPWSGGQAFDLRHQPSDEAVAQGLQLPPGRRFDVNVIFSHAGGRA